MVHKSQFTNLPVASDALVCDHCKKHLERGSDAFMKFSRTRYGTSTQAFCDEFCLADYNEKRESTADKMLKRLKIQFN